MRNWELDELDWTMGTQPGSGSGSGSGLHYYYYYYYYSYSWRGGGERRPKPNVIELLRYASGILPRYLTLIVALGR